MGHYRCRNINISPDDISSIETSFLDGCSLIASKITSLGVNTASDASPDIICDNIQTLVDNGNILKYNSVELITNSSGKTSAPLTYTTTEDLDCAVTVSVVGSGVGGGNYTTKILIDDIEVVSSLSEFFNFNNSTTKFISLKNGQTVKIINSGNATNSTGYQYTYGTKLYKFIV